MSQIKILKGISFHIETRRLAKKLRIPETGRMRYEFKHLCNEAEQIACPKAIVRGAYIDKKEEDYVVIEGIRLSSQVLRINLEATERVFLICATCGIELFNWAGKQADGLHRFWADTIQEIAMRQAIANTQSYIKKKINPGKIGMQNPGSLEDWPIEEQGKLFELIGNVESSINVTLSEGRMMVPVYSISGIVFPAEINFVNCMLCRSKKCPQRRAAFNEELYKNRYGLKIRESQFGPYV